ncbi:MAG: ABC transporter ATP-binding protein, partial [Pseudomonadota bacterium]
LINWGFPFNQHSRKVNVLSGGERARLMLLMFQLDQPNLLVMDEPTNHIDLQGKEELENDLQQSGLSLLFTSHDQRFIENIATRFWWIRNQKLIEIHDPALYFDYLEELSGTSSDDSDVAPGGADTEVLTTEEIMLERMCELEKLLSEDLARKPKFQKPERQHQWQSELDDLMSRLR